LLYWHALAIDQLLGSTIEPVEGPELPLRHVHAAIEDDCEPEECKDEETVGEQFPEREPPPQCLRIVHGVPAFVVSAMSPKRAPTKIRPTRPPVPGVAAAAVLGCGSLASACRVVYL